MGRGGRGGQGGGGGGRKSLNSKFDNLVRSKRVRPLELLAPNRGMEVVERGREAERQALMERFGIGENAPRGHSSINLPHLPRLQTLANFSHSKPRVNRSLRSANERQNAKTIVTVPEPAQWLVDIMYPERAQRSLSPGLSPAVSPFDEQLVQEENIPIREAQPQQLRQVAPLPPPQRAPTHPPVLLKQPFAPPPFAVSPQISMQGSAGWGAPLSNPAATAMATRPFGPLWWTPHGVLDMAGRPINLPSPLLPPTYFRQRGRGGYSHAPRYLPTRKRPRRRFTSYSPGSDGYDDDSEYGDYDESDEYEYEPRLRRGPRQGRRRRSRLFPIAEDRRDEGDAHKPSGHKRQRMDRLGLNGLVDEHDEDFGYFEEEDRRDGVFEEELPRAAMPTPPPVATKYSDASCREQDPSVRARLANAPVQAPAKIDNSCDDDDVALSQPPRQRAIRQAVQLPTPPQVSSTISASRPEEDRSGLRGPRLIQTLERAAENMTHDMSDENSPFLEPMYPPTPATTATSSAPRSQVLSVPSNPPGSSSEASGKSPARMQRATERAWAALAAMQPRHEHQDPVATAMPAPPSPALAPVDADVTDDEEMFEDIEDSESICEFSDDGHFETDVPQFDLSWDEEEEEIEAAAAPPAAQSYPKSSIGVSDKTTTKRVRFAWDIGGVGESDPGFKVWRDGY